MKGKKVLIVEDEFLIAKDIEGLLLDEGYEVISYVSTVDQAIQMIESNEPDLVLTDISLIGDKDGVDLGLYLIKKDTTPFIYLTSHTDKLIMDRVKETRPYGFIVKPFKDVDVKTTVEIVLNNFTHRKIDVVRSAEEVNNDIPFVLKKVINHINDHISEKIKVEELAQLTKWKSQHFQRLFFKYVGTTPNQYILNRKVEKAKGLLIETEMTVSEISFELGFQSTSNFFNAFKKITGKTPGIYRSWHHSNNDH
ncbi:MAG: response regulator transcription factor [Flavobacteriales bacterium]|nr:response regulator transcription factor [Flavobacteriales bacterium]